MTRKRLIVIGPLPPPVHGVTVSTSLVLANTALSQHFEVEHLDTSDHRSGQNIGGWDAANTLGALRAIVRLSTRLRGRKGVVYLPLSQSTPGFLRDSLFVLLAHTMRWRVTIHLRGSDFRTYYETLHLLGKWWIRFILRRVSSVAVMGDTLRWVFHGLVADERIVVVPNGTPEPPRVGVLRDPKHVLFLSNLRRRKGVVEAVEAALLVLGQVPSARFTFAGSWESEELEDNLRARVRQFADAIEFSGAVDEEGKNRLLASAGILLFPPVEPEGHPRVVLEAMAAGLPVVATDRGAIRETVGNEDAGFVIAEPDPVALAECVLLLLADPSLRERMSQGARGRYLSHFTQELADRRLSDWLVNVAR